MSTLDPKITAIAKERAGAQHGLAFYDETVVNTAHNEPRAGRKAGRE